MTSSGFVEHALLIDLDPAYDATASVVVPEDSLCLDLRLVASLGLTTAYVLAVVQSLAAYGVGRPGAGGVTWIAGSADEWHRHRFTCLTRSAMCVAFQRLIRAGYLRQTRGDDGRAYTALDHPRRP